MASALKIVFKGETTPDQAGKIDIIERRYHRLRRKNRSVIRCRVVVDNQHRRRRNGNEQRVTADLVYPGGEVFARSVVKDGRGERGWFKAINEAFGSLEQQLHDARQRSAATRRGPRLLLDPAPSIGAELVSM